MAERDVHEEPLGGALGFGEAPVLQIGAHDACVVSAVPAMPGRSGDELEPESYRRRRWLPGRSASERHRFASIAKQPLVHGTPPPATGRRRIERVEHTTVHLPAYKRQCRPSEW